MEECITVNLDEKVAKILASYSANYYKEGKICGNVSSFEIQYKRYSSTVNALSKVHIVVTSDIEFARMFSDLGYTVVSYEGKYYITDYKRVKHDDLRYLTSKEKKQVRMVGRSIYLVPVDVYENIMKRKNDKEEFEIELK